MSKITVLKMDGILLPKTSSGQTQAFYQSGEQMATDAVAQVWTADLSKAQVDGLLGLIQATDKALQDLTVRVAQLEQRNATLMAKIDQAGDTSDSK